MSSKPGGDGASRNDTLHAGARFVGRVVALVVGVIFMVVGVALGVTVVLLPLGVPLTIAGLLLCVAAVALGRSRASEK